MYKILSLVLIVIFYNIINIQDSSAGSLTHCVPNRAYSNNFEPETFSPSNNLLRKSGEQELICGKKLIIRGKLVDRNCVPISDAKVFMWQVACDGKYPYMPLKNIAEGVLINTKSASTFTGAGTATTDNKGEFYFITIVPKAVHGDKPHVNLRVVHHQLGEFDTKIYITHQEFIEPPIPHETPYYETENSLNEVRIVMPVVNELRNY